MEKTIKIDGRDVPFKASAMTPILYRRMNGREFFADLKNLFNKFDSDGVDFSNLDAQALMTFRDLAYTMAKQADPELPGVDEWFDGFEMFSIYYVLPEIVAMWAESEKTTSKPKKK